MAVELVVGLGNPGQEYAATRHNVGFRVVDELARRFQATRWERRGPSQVARAACGSWWLARPQTYMNRSGVAVLSLATGFSLPPESILVVTDDVDLPLGRLRLRRSGGPGTHNGLRDVVAAVGPGFPRLRVGVQGERLWDDLAEYVLAPFEPHEEEIARAAVERAAEAVATAVSAGLEEAMSRFNRATPEPEAAGEQ